MVKKKNGNVKRRHSRTAIALICALSIIILFCSAFFIYVENYYHADSFAVEASVSGVQGVRVEAADNGDIAFIPSHPTAGLIFYPGGKVEYTAYAPLMQALAQRGILCVLIKMPFRLAVFDISAADGVCSHYPDISDWYMSGHSLGGSMAADYVSKNVRQYKGLILLAAYSTADLSQSGLRVLSLYGSDDGVLNREKLTEYQAYLPASSQEIIIDGGCHAGFGNYGVQHGDGIPSITNDEQIAQTADLISDFILNTK